MLARRRRAYPPFHGASTWTVQQRGHTEYTRRLLAAFGRAEKPTSAAPVSGSEFVEPLSERELEVLRLVAEGLSNRQIAERLVLSLGTVKSHIHHIYGKLGASKRTQAVARARQLGLI